MDFRILGPLEAHRNGAEVSTGGPKQRALLALLLLHANETVSRAALVDGLWGERPPETAAKALQVYVSQLRRSLGRELVVTRPGGYQLAIAPDALDLFRFERLVGEARAAAPAPAAAKLREALALWRGRPLADLAEAPFAQTETRRLEELRLAAADEWTDAELALGRESELIPELERAVAHNPLRERPRAQLMLALYRCGRQAEALECYQTGRRALIDELGVEPGRALRDLHQAILRQDAELHVPPAEGRRDESVAEVGKPPAVERGEREVRKTVTVVCVALTAVSDRGEALDPETLRRLTSRAFVEVETTVEAHGGTLEPPAGDAISAVFGLPTLHEDDALRAIRSAVEVRPRLASLADAIDGERGARLAFAIGVSTGEVVTGGAAGVQLRATGVPLALSSRLAQTADPGDILVDDGTLRLARDEVVVEAAGVVSTRASRVLRVVDGLSRHASRLSSPMVGRERERRRLQDAFEQAAGDASCQLFTVLGPAGVGKSRLVREFLGDLTGRARVARGRCLPYGEGITFWPLLEAVKEAVGLDDADTPEAAHAKLLQAFGDEEDADLLARRVAETIGLSDVSGGAEERVGAVLALFQALARDRPLVLVFDDIHWAEPTFLDLVEHVADWARDSPILLVCLARPDLLEARSGWAGGKLNATSTFLEPLSPAECAVLIENLVGQAELTNDVEASIADAADGNPLFVEEMLAMLIDDGVLVRRNGRWVATGDLPAVRVPPTIHALLAARLDRLDPNERVVIERAAAQGKIFYDDAVADLAGNGEIPVAAALGALVRKELIRPDRPGLGGRTHRFRHLLIRDAAYESIPKEARAATHEHFARWLDRAAGAAATQYDEIVGYHLEQAYGYLAELGLVDDAARAVARAAAGRLGGAGRRAFVRSDAPAGVKLVSRAVALMSPDDPLRVELVPNVRAVQGSGADMTWADRVLTEAVEAAATSGDRRLAAHALVQRGLLRLFTVSAVTPQELIDAAERAISVFAELGDELGLARAWRLKAQAQYLARDAGSCADASENALEHVRRAGDSFEEREIIEWLVIALLLGPTPAAEAEIRCERLLAETTDSPQLQAEILGALAILASMLERTEDAERLLRRAWSIMDDGGQRIWIVSFWASFIFMWQGDPVRAESELRPGYDALKKIGEKSHFSSISHSLSNAVYMQGRDDEAEALTRECEEAAWSNDIHSFILWRTTRAKVLARRGEVAAAETLAREAVAFAAGSDFLVAHADSLGDLAEVLELAGRRHEAVHALRSAIELHERKGNVLAVGQARRRLDELPV